MIIEKCRPSSASYSAAPTSGSSIFHTENAVRYFWITSEVDVKQRSFAVSGPTL